MYYKKLAEILKTEEVVLITYELVPRLKFLEKDIIKESAKSQNTKMFTHNL